MRIYKEELEHTERKIPKMSPEKGKRESNKFRRQDLLIEDEDTIYEIDGECEQCRKQQNIL